MSWTLWMAGAIVLFLPGALYVRAGKLKVVRLYLAACVLLILAWVFGLGGVFGPEYASVPKLLLSMVAPGTLILLLWGTQRDRERVMGSQEDRDAIATAAILAGATLHGTEAGGDMGDSGGGDA